MATFSLQVCWVGWCDRHVLRALNKSVGLPRRNLWHVSGINLKTSGWKKKKIRSWYQKHVCVCESVHAHGVNTLICVSISRRFFKTVLFRLSGRENPSNPSWFKIQIPEVTVVFKKKKSHHNLAEKSAEAPLIPRSPLAPHMWRGSVHVGAGSRPDSARYGGGLKPPPAGRLIWD